MDNDIDPQLRELFAAYAPAMGEEAFLADIRCVLAREEKQVRLRSDVVLAALLLLVACVAVLSLGPAARLFSSIQGALVRASDTLPSILSHLCVYGMTLALGYLGRRRLWSFLAPW